MRTKNCLRNNKGQTLVEYILMLSIVASLAVMVVRFLNKNLVFEKMLGGQTMFTKIEKNYRYGDPRTKGWEDGGPEEHPLVDQPGNFKLFTEADD